MKQKKDSRFGKVWEPESFNELVELLVGTSSAVAPVRMWRGQANEDWSLHSSAYRKLLLSNDAPGERDVAYYERRLLDKATHQGFRYLDGRELSDFELLARLQHHGAATRLIDTTRNALIALFFACADLPKEAGLLFGIHCDHLGGSEGQPLMEDYETHIKSIDRYPHPQTWEPSVVSRRVSAQHSQFIYSGIKQKLSHGSLALNEINRSLLTIRIKAESKRDYLNVLQRNFDITPLSLFPDIDGFGRAHGQHHEQWSTERW